MVISNGFLLKGTRKLEIAIENFMMEELGQTRACDCVRTKLQGQPMGFKGEVGDGARYERCGMRENVWAGRRRAIRLRLDCGETEGER